MSNDITTTNENYMNYETIENPVSQSIPDNGPQTFDDVIISAIPVLRMSSRVMKQNLIV